MHDFMSKLMPTINYFFNRLGRHEWAFLFIIAEKCLSAEAEKPSHSRTWSNHQNLLIYSHEMLIKRRLQQRIMRNAPVCDSIDSFRAKHAVKYLRQSNCRICNVFVEHTESNETTEWRQEWFAARTALQLKSHKSSTNIWRRSRSQYYDFHSEILNY